MDKNTLKIAHIVCRAADFAIYSEGNVQMGIREEKSTKGAIEMSLFWNDLT